MKFSYSNNCSGVLNNLTKSSSANLDIGKTRQKKTLRVSILLVHCHPNSCHNKKINTKCLAKSFSVAARRQAARLDTICQNSVCDREEKLVQNFRMIHSTLLINAMQQDLLSACCIMPWGDTSHWRCILWVTQNTLFLHFLVTRKAFFPH